MTSPDLPWSGGHLRYAGWVPNVRTHLSFSIIGEARDADALSLPIGARRRVAVMLQRRTVNDFPIPTWLAARRVPGIVTDWLLEAETEPTQVPHQRQDEIVGERDRQGMLRGSITYLPLLIGEALSERRDLGAVHAAIQNVVRLDEIAKAGGDEDAVAARDRALEDVRRVARLAAEASGDHVSVEFALMRTGECRLWFPDVVGGRSEPELDVVARHAYYFLKDAVHAHTHHDPTSDQITPLVRDVPEDVPEPGHSHEEAWRRETLWSLSREIERLNRDGGLTEQRRSLGIIAYAEAFQAALLGHVRDPEAPSGFSRSVLVHDYDFKHLKDSIRADIEVNATRLTQSIQISIALVGTFISTVALVSSLVSAHNSGDAKTGEGAPVHAAHLGWIDGELPLLSLDPALTAAATSIGLLVLLVVFVFDKRSRFRTGLQRGVSQFGRALGVTITANPRWQLSIDLAMHIVSFVLAAAMAYVCICFLFD